MRRHRWTLVSALACAFVAGCGSDDPVSPPGSAGSGGFGGEGAGGQGGVGAQGGSGGQGGFGGQGGEGGGTACTPGEEQPCYTGPQGTENVGLCAAGTQTCAPSGEGFGECVGETTPAVENCATELDEDCDGVVTGCSGDHVWGYRFGLADRQAAYNLAVDSKGNVVVTGAFAGIVDFGGDALASAGSTDAFIVKFDSDGQHLWSKRFGGSGTDAGWGVAVDVDDRIHMAGEFRETINFGGAPLNSEGSTDGFVAVFEPDGTHVRSARYGGASADAIYAIAAHGKEMVITGYFSDAISFGAGTLDGAGSADVFLAKLDAQGGALWSRGFGGVGAEYGYSVAVDPFGNILLTGPFEGTVDFGQGNLVSAGGTDVFLARFTSNGNTVWSESFGGVGNDAGWFVKADPSGNVVVAGNFNDTMDFGGGALALTSAGQADAFLAKLSPLGTHIWSKRFGGEGADLAYAIDVDPAGNVLMTGYFSSTVDFGGGQFTSAGKADGFLAKLSPSGAHVHSRQFGDSEFEAGWCVKADGVDGILLGGEFEGSVNLGGVDLVSQGASDLLVAKFLP